MSDSHPGTPAQSGRQVPSMLGRDQAWQRATKHYPQLLSLANRWAAELGQAPDTNGPDELWTLIENLKPPESDEGGHPNQTAEIV